MVEHLLIWLDVTYRDGTVSSAKINFTWHRLCITIEAHKSLHNLEFENYSYKCNSILCNTFLDSQYKTSVIYFCNITHISGWICTSKHSFHIWLKPQQNSKDIHRCWIITETHILKSSAVVLSLAIMQLNQFKSTSCYNTELRDDRSIFGVVKIITFSSHIQNHYSGLLPRHITTVTLQAASESAIISTAHAHTLWEM